MAFDFWKAQDSARRWTYIYLLLFVVGMAATAILAEAAFAVLTGYHEPVPWIGIAFGAITVIVALQQYSGIKRQGGAFVAEQQGGQKVDANTSDLRLRQLYNTVHEMALAAGVPVPEVYVIPSPAINAFAAGLDNDRAVVAVTAGALQLLSRDELQGVVGHEVGHIRNGDMILNVRLGVLVAGFFAVVFWGMRLLQYQSMPGMSSGHRRSPLALIGLVLLGAGAISWFIGSVLKACVSRQREYFADASAVQFTRNPNGIRRALIKILQESHRRMPVAGGAYAHLYLDNRQMFGGLFATHPPLESRINRLSGSPEDYSEIAGPGSRPGISVRN